MPRAWGTETCAQHEIRPSGHLQSLVHVAGKGNWSGTRSSRSYGRVVCFGAAVAQYFPGSIN